MRTAFSVRSYFLAQKWPCTTRAPLGNCRAAPYRERNPAGSTFISDFGSIGRSALSRTIWPLPNTLSSQTAKLVPAVLGTCTEMITFFIHGRPSVVEGDDVFDRPRHIGDDEANPRIEFAGMSVAIGDHPTRFLPARSK